MCPASLSEEPHDGSRRIDLTLPRSHNLGVAGGNSPKVKVVVCLGKIAWDGYLAHLVASGEIARRSLYTFRHGAEYLLPKGIYLLGSYHPSLRNTNTGRLNAEMFARVFVRARELAGLS